MWEVFSKLFRKYWKDCPYHIILVTDKYKKTEKEYVFDKVAVCDDTWARMIKKAVNEVGTPYVMLWMDDYLLCDYVSNDDVEKQLGRAKHYHAANFRLTESPECAGIYKENDVIGYYKRGEAYSLDTQVGIWDCGFLKKFIRDEWSAWDFERIGSLSREYREQPVLVSLDYEFPYEEGVRQGKWMQQGAKLCKRNGIRPDYSKRPVMTNAEMAKIYFKGAILDWNPTLVVKIQNMVMKVNKRKQHAK